MRPDRAGALPLMDQMDDAGPDVAAANVVAVDHLVELFGSGARGAIAMLGDHLAREPFDFGVAGDHACVPPNIVGEQVSSGMPPQRPLECRTNAGDCRARAAATRNLQLTPRR